MSAVTTAARLAARAAYAVAGAEGVAKLLLVSIPRATPTILRTFGAYVGAHPVIHSPLILVNPPTSLGGLSIGDECHLGKDVLLDLAAPISIGARVTLSMGARIITHVDVGASALASAGFARRTGAVRIEDDVYLGANVVVLHGVTIGRCSAVGAGAVVTRDIPSYSVAVGVPARVIRSLEPHVAAMAVEAPR